MAKTEKRFLTLVLSEEDVPWEFKSDEADGVAAVAVRIEIPVGGLLDGKEIRNAVDNLRYGLNDLIVARENKEEEEGAENPDDEE